MRGVRDLWSELVERRLWPVALLLVVALVAVPVVLAKKPTAEEPATTTASPAAAAARAADLRTAGEPVVSVAAGAGAGAPLRGHTKNPFKQQHVPATAAIEGGTPATGTAPAATGTGGGGTDTGSGGGGNSGGAGDGDQGQTPQTYTYAAIDVRFGRAGLPLRTIHDVPRLTPLPSATQPIVIFMGMRADHETAVFMVSTDVHAQGEGRCVPSKKLCEAIELRRDQIALLDWAEPDGSVTQYELDLADVTLHETTSKAKAQATVAEARASWIQRDAAGASAHRRGAPQAAAGTAPRGPSLVPLP
jgi:hypothetical protein